MSFWRHAPCLLAGYVGNGCCRECQSQFRKEVPRIATAPAVRFRRNASRSTGAPKTNIPYKKETADGRKRRSTTSALTISGPFSVALIIVILTLTFLFSLAACATVDSPSRDGRASAGAPLTLLPKETSSLV